MKYFTDDDKFQLRELNLSFYNAYFRQVVNNFDTTLNVPRTIKLAARGRVFESLKFLSILCSQVPVSMLRSITATYFPKLESIRATIGNDTAAW